MSTSPKAASPKQRTSPTTKNPQRAKSPSADVAIPATVTELAKLSAHERILREAQAQRKSRSPFRAGFGSAERSVVEGPSSKPASPISPHSPQKQRREQLDQEKEEHVFASVEKKLSQDKLPSYVEATSAFNVPKEKDHSRWARAANDRHMYQYNWGSFPDAHPQRCLVDVAPGPGAYGKSTSFCV